MTDSREWWPDLLSPDAVISVSKLRPSITQNGVTHKSAGLLFARANNLSLLTAASALRDPTVIVNGGKGGMLTCGFFDVKSEIFQKLDTGVEKLF